MWSWIECKQADEVNKYQKKKKKKKERKSWSARIKKSDKKLKNKKY